MDCGLNKIMVIGHLGRDPEMRFTPNGKSASYFSLVHKHTWENAEGTTQTHTEWFNVIAWGKLGRNCQTALEER